MYKDRTDESRNLAWEEMAKKIDRNDPEELVRCICLCPDKMRISKLFIFLLGKAYANHMLSYHTMDKEYHIWPDFDVKIHRVDNIHMDNIRYLGNEIFYSINSILRGDY